MRPPISIASSSSVSCVSTTEYSAVSPLSVLGGRSVSSSDSIGVSVGLEDGDCEGLRLGRSLGIADGLADGLAVAVPRTRTDCVVENGFGSRKLSAET